MAAGTEQGPLRAGGKFLNYAIRGLIDRGGHAWVYHGHNELLDHHVAIKILHRPGGVTNDMLRRGRAEAKFLFHLKHPNIVEVLDAGMTDEGLFYIVMELLRGASLRRVLRDRGQLPLGIALPMFAAIAEGMRAAHATKAIHRDLKPENIFVLEDGTPKVLDFGIAKIQDAAGFTTEKDILHGTVLYMSPEQLKGQGTTVRSDVYALGLALFETTFGRHPCLLASARPNLHELTRIQMTERPPRLHELDQRIPSYVGRLVDRMLAKLPEQRIASMAELRDALRECHRRYTGDPQNDRLSAATSAPTPVLGPHDTDPVDPPAFLEPSATVPLTVQSGADSLPNQVSTRTSPRPGKAFTPSTAPPVTTGAPRLHAGRGAAAQARRTLWRVIAASVAIGGTTSAIAMVYLGRTEPAGRSVAESTLTASAEAAVAEGVTERAPPPALPVASAANAAASTAPPKIAADSAPPASPAAPALRRESVSPSLAAPPSKPEPKHGPAEVESGLAGDRLRRVGSGLETKTGKTLQRAPGDHDAGLDSRDIPLAH